MRRAAESFDPATGSPVRETLIVTISPGTYAAGLRFTTPQYRTDGIGPRAASVRRDLAAANHVLYRDAANTKTLRNLFRRFLRSGLRGSFSHYANAPNHSGYSSSRDATPRELGVKSGVRRHIAGLEYLQEVLK